MEDIIYTKNPMETQKFFDFEFQVLDGQVLDCYFQGGGEKIKLEPCIGQGLFLIKQKYENKNLDIGGLELDITRLKQELSETDLYKEIRVKEQQLEEMKQREQEIKDSILEGMLISDTKTLEVNNQRYTVKQNPPALKIVDESKIPEKYKEEKTEIVINKAELKKDLKEGYPIEGAELTKGYSLQITVK